MKDSLLLLLSVVHIVYSVQNGPCRILNNGMKCTEEGYFALVQCDSSSCFCVQANNAEIAYQTKTRNSKTAPECALCYKRLQQLYAGGQPHKDSYIPLCDNRKGDFQPVQCTADGRTCFCVDTDTGKEVPGTKKQVSNSQVMICEDVPTIAEIFPTVPGGRAQVVYPVGKETCKLDRDRGHRCSGRNPVQQYYFDSETFECLSFEYLGCGGNENRYPKKSDCVSGCKLPDLSGCSGMHPPAKGRNGKVINCGSSMMGGMMGGPPPTTASSHGPRTPDDECPRGYKCNMGPFFGSCCNIENEKLFERNYRPVCENRRTPVREKNPEYVEYLLGKTCADNFCSPGTTCQQGEIFAACC